MTLAERNGLALELHDVVNQKLFGLVLAAESAATLLARGPANKRIARELGVSEKTVKTHVGHVLAKLGVTDRTQAALHALREGLLPRE